MKIYNADQLDENFIWRDNAGLVTQALGTAAGSQKIYVNIDKVPPDAFSTKYHSHSQHIAHQFYNSGNDVLIILDVGTVEKEDTCYYPDDDVYLHKSNGENKAFRKQSLLNNWTSDPNGK